MPKKLKKIKDEKNKHKDNKRKTHISQLISQSSTLQVMTLIDDPANLLLSAYKVPKPDCHRKDIHFIDSEKSGILAYIGFEESEVQSDNVTKKMKK